MAGKRVRHIGGSTQAELLALDVKIMEIAEREAPVTVRGMFYRCVSGNLIPKTEEGYRKVMRRVLKLRRDGIMPYGWIADGSRIRFATGTYADGTEALSEAHKFYRRDLWQRQDTYVEVWSEKDAISSVIRPITDNYGVPLLITRGYSSETFLYNSAEEIMEQDKDVLVYQLGDHDPSGVDAWRATQDRLREFTRGFPHELHFMRLAVTPQQITDLSLPTRPTKAKDTRSAGFSGESVEVDAIPSPTLRAIVEDGIVRLIDERDWNIEKMIEDEEKDDLYAMIKSYERRRARRAKSA